jgi:hypothetical protein
MVARVILMFVAGLLAGLLAPLAWVVVGVGHGFWWGAATASLVLLATILLAARPLLDGIRARFWEAVSLFLWAEQNAVEHNDPTAVAGTYHGTALALVMAHRGVWSCDETVRLLRDLRQHGSGTARDPETGNRFVVFRSEPLLSAKTGAPNHPPTQKDIARKPAGVLAKPAEDRDAPEQRRRLLRAS